MKRRPQQVPADLPTRYAAGGAWFGMIVLAAGLVSGPVWLLYLLLEENAPDAGRGVVFLLFLICLALTAFALAIEAWTRFEVRSDGLAQHKLGRKRFAPWSVLSHVSNSDMGVGNVNSDPNLYGDLSRFQEGSTSPDAFVFLVIDREGRQAFKIPPWVSRRRELVRQVQGMIRRARERESSAESR